MAKRQMYKKKSPTYSIMYGLLILVVVVIVLSMTLSKSKENLGFRNIIADDKVRDRQKKACRSQGGDWHRGGDLVSDSIWGYDSTCTKYRIDQTMMGGYCCYPNNVNPKPPVKTY